MPNLAKILPRCHSTVRADRNSWAPISGLVSPSRARRAICPSCGGSGLRVSTLRLRTPPPVGARLPPRSLGERLHPDRCELVDGGAQLLARVDAPALAAQPLTVKQVGAGKLGTQPGTAQPVDRLVVQDLGGLRATYQRAG